MNRGTVVDATIIESSVCPLSKEKRKELQVSSSAQIDTDADSTKKNGPWYFGYKGHIGADVGSKLIRPLSFTKTSPHDSTQLEALLAGNERNRRVRRYGMRLATAKNKLRNKARFVMSAICWNIGRSISCAKTKPDLAGASAP